MSSFVAIEHSSVVAILQSVRCLMNHQSVLNTAILGPMLQIRATKTGDRAKVYTIFIDYDMGVYGRRVRIYIERSRRRGLSKCTRIDIPSGELSRFEATNESWYRVHMPFLFGAMTRELPMALCNMSATAMVSTKIANMPPLRDTHSPLRV